MTCPWHVRVATDQGAQFAPRIEDRCVHYNRKGWQFAVLFYMLIMGLEPERVRASQKCLLYLCSEERRCGSAASRAADITAAKSLMAHQRRNPRRCRGFLL